ncbi:MAG: glycosyltransferase [Candidatus Woesebacteria bacterium]|nr:MAG: glycosyltransferase [Candidatus Woesebacteria bacterium]
MKISAHVLLKNEARFVWYSIMSVLHHVDDVYVWDTGSTDDTTKIIEQIMKSNKGIHYKKMVGNSFDEEKLRGEMLSNDSSDWIITVDGDEIWWEDSIKKVVDTIRYRGEDVESIVVPTYNLVGDMFHYQEKEAGRYNLAGRVGHYNLRAFNRRIPGLIAKGEHGVFGWFDSGGKRIEERDPTKIVFVDAPYLHVTHLQRSGKKFGDNEVYKRSRKLKYEIGDEFPKDFYYPEVFFRDRPKIVPSVWNTPDLKFKFRSVLETPVRKIHRRTFLRFQKYGY